MKHDELFKLAVITVNSLPSGSKDTKEASLEISVRDMYARLSDLDKELQAEHDQPSDEEFLHAIRNPL